MIICPDLEFVDGTYTQKQEELPHLHLDSYNENCCDEMSWKEIPSFSALQTTMKEIPHLLRDHLRDWDRHAADSSLPSCLASGLHRTQTALRMTAVTTDFTRSSPCCSCRSSCEFYWRESAHCLPWLAATDLRAQCVCAGVFLCPKQQRKQKATCFHLADSRLLPSCWHYAI